MSERKKRISAVIDGKTVTVPAGTTILNAAESIGVTIPVFCYHPKLTISGSCRMCLVEIEGGTKPVTACSTELLDGVVVHTNTPTVLEARSEVMENLLINHPLDCPICDKGGECLLQDNAYDWGPGRSRYTERKRLFQKPVPLSDRILLDRERCILCTRCVRFCDEISDHHELTIVETGGGSYIDVAPDASFKSQFSGNTTDLCPVGALTSTSFRFKARPWEMQSTPGVCPFCGCGCNIFIETRTGKILRFMVRENPELDDGWLCDRGRYGFGIANSPDRLRTPLVRKQGRLVVASWDEAVSAAVDKLRRTLSQYGPGAVGGVGSEWGTNEENELLQRMIRESLGSPNVDCTLADDGRPAALAIAEGLGTFEFSEIDRADSILLIGADPSLHQPIIDLRIKKALRNRAVSLLSITSGDVEMNRHATSSLQYPAGSEDALLRVLTAALKKEQWYETHDADLKASRLSRETVDLSLATSLTGTQRIVLVGAGLVTSDVHVYLFKELVAALGPNARFGLLFGSSNGFGARMSGAVNGYLPGLRSTEQGLCGRDMLAAAERATLKALYIIGMERHDTGIIARARRGAEFILCHTMEMNEASKAADVVFPAVAFSEKQGTLINTAGRRQEIIPALRPPGHARPESQVLEDIIRKLRG